MGLEDHDMMFAENLLACWRAIGSAEKLDTDTDIAKFLVALYTHTKGKFQTDWDGFKCARCHSSLMVHCTNCSLPHRPLVCFNPHDPLTSVMGALPMLTEDQSPGKAPVLQQVIISQVITQMVSQGPIEQGGSSSQQAQAVVVQEDVPVDGPKPLQECPSLQHGPQTQVVPQTQSVLVRQDLPLGKTESLHELQQGPPVHQNSPRLRQTGAALVLQQDLPLGQSELEPHNPSLQPAPSLLLVQEGQTGQQETPVVQQALRQAWSLQQTVPLQQTAPWQQTEPLQQQTASLQQQTASLQQQTASLHQENAFLQQEAAPLQQEEFGETTALRQSAPAHPDCTLTEDFSEHAYVWPVDSLEKFMETQTAGRLETGGDSVNTVQLSNLAGSNDFYMQDGGTSFESNAAPVENKTAASEITTKSHQAPHIHDETGNNFSPMEISNQTCSTEIKRSRSGRVLMPKNDPTFVSGIQRKVWSSAESPRKQSLKKQFKPPSAKLPRGQSPKKPFRLLNADSPRKQSLLPKKQFQPYSGTDPVHIHRVDESKDMESLECWLHPSEKLRGSVVRCDKVFEKDLGNFFDESASTSGCESQKKQEYENNERRDRRQRGKSDASVALDPTSASQLTTEVYSNADISSEEDDDSAFLQTSVQISDMSWSIKDEASKTEVESSKTSRDNFFSQLFKCSHCERTFTHQAHLIRHLSHHQERSTGWDRSDIKEPSEASKPNRMRPFVCKVCGKSYRVQSALSLHLKTHAKPGDYLECDLCGLKFTEERNVVRHKMKFHPGGANLKCKLCDFQCAANSHMKNHMKRKHWKHTTQQCEYCGVHMQPQSLAAHVLMHQNTKPHSCDKCEQSFRTKSGLNSHHRAHHGELERPFRCDQCGLGFIKSQTLRDHMFSHTGEKPFQCPKCPSRFVRKDYLNKHMRTHTGEKPFQCSVCKLKFAQVSSLNNHKGKVHSVKSPKKKVHRVKSPKKKLHSVKSPDAESSEHVPPSVTQMLEIPVESLGFLETAYLLPVYTGSPDEIVYSTTLIA